MNQEVLFSTALTGKPLRKEAFSEYRWDRCAVGFQDSVPATQHPAWIVALNQGKLRDRKTRNNEQLNFYYNKAVDEGYEAFKVGRADNEVAVGDLIERLLSISFACKDEC